MSTSPPQAVKPIVALFGVFFAASAHGAGGHHAVDDAAVLDPGKCQIEGWGDRAAHVQRSLIHLGGLCRTGPIEVELTVERSHDRTEGDTSQFTPQIKFAHPLTSSLSIGGVANTTWDQTARRLSGWSFVIPLTWKVNDELLVHGNVGRDIVRKENDETRWGGAVEWSPATTTTFLVESFRQMRTNSLRVGARYFFSEDLTADLSWARSNQNVGSNIVTFGLNWQFDR